jgi:phosphate transport system ATP-binding protein
MSDCAVRFDHFNAWYGSKQALRDVNLEIPKHCIYAFIGPSGCGKTTLLRSINRMNDLIRGFRYEGELEINGSHTAGLTDKKDIAALRRGIGMVFQHPNPLPGSISHNMALPLLEHFTASKKQLNRMICERLRQGALYEEVRDKLHKPAQALSGGQQQRLCIARALMLDPPMMLFDEPCSALDPIATFAIEELLMELKKTRTIIIVTHNMEQARRISDYTAFFYMGEVVESGVTSDLFAHPKSERLQRYIMGRDVG